MPVAGDKARDNGGQQGNEQKGRGIDAGETGDEAVDFRLAGRSVLHAVQNALHHALREHVGDADLYRAVRVDAAGNDRVAGRNADRDRLAGDSRGIQTGLALGNLAVKRYAVARTDENEVADFGLLRRENFNAAVRLYEVHGFGTQVDGVHDLLAGAVYGAVLEVFTDAVEQHDADRLIERADRPCADGRDRHQEVFVEYLSAADVLDRRQQNVAAEQQIRRDHQSDFDRCHRNDQTRDKERRADQHFRERVTAFLVLLLLLGGDDLDLALDIRADFADFREQGVRVFALDAQLLGFVDEHAVVNAVELTDLVLHLGGAVGTAEVFERVDALAVLAVVFGRGGNDLGIALNA